MWADADWRSLTPLAQHLYMLLLSHPTLTYAGVADWRPGRIAQFSRTQTAHDVVQCGIELQGKEFVLIDDETEEVLVRSFVKHDGLMKQPKLAVSMANAYAAVASTKIREVIAFELQKLQKKEPELSAWTAPQVKTILSAQATDISVFTPAFTPPLTPAFRGNGGQELAEPTTTGTTTTTSSNKSVQKSAHDYSEEFEQWWQVYPRKQGKAAAVRKYAAVRKHVSAEVLMTGVRTYALLSAGEDKAFIKLPAGWLNDGRWEDEAIASPASSPKPRLLFCPTHDGYPLPCERCARDAEIPEGNDF
jgi:hypothetical protein